VKPDRQTKTTFVSPYALGAVKRWMDILGSLAGLILTAPILGLAACFIYWDDGLPILYRASRVGRRGFPFVMLKLRTMSRNADQQGSSSTPEDDARITRPGRVLRKWKLDEVPQLVNVLKGQMSLVGPRPQVQWAVDLYRPEERLLLRVRPGLTDFASIKFRNEGWILRGCANPDLVYLRDIAPAKIDLGLRYVKTASLMTDVRIICMTLQVALGGERSKESDGY
jgi:lipopolysaccharide/colanic/teichoic acid biosynthesis glycosyltransferase